MASIVIVDDDRAIRDAVSRTLRLDGHETHVAADGVRGLELIESVHAELAVLDVAMPNLNGLELVTLLRARGFALPVLMLTARVTLADRVGGLDAGADDYLVKPFEVDELRARVRALLRRPAPNAMSREAFGLRADLAQRRVWFESCELRLTKTEFELLSVFVASAGTVLTASQLYESVWGYDLSRTSGSLAVYINYLRRKLTDAGAPPLLHAVRGVGYVLRPEGGL